MIPKYLTLKPQIMKLTLSPIHLTLNSNNKSFLSGNSNWKYKQLTFMLKDIFAFSWIHTAIVLQHVDPLKAPKIQQTVMALKEQVKDRMIQPSTPLTKKKKSFIKKIKEEVQHYYQGFRLLNMNMKIATKLTLKKFRGFQLTRREHRLLTRTLGDIFRLVPFSVFILVPFMELTLPIFLKFFPGMLPSTFQTKSEKEAKIKQHFKLKLEMTKFLQETLEEMPPVTVSERVSDLAKEFSDFYLKIRTTGHIASSQEIVRYSKLFEDDITLDKLSRPQIVALCRMLFIKPFGTTRFLIYQLKLKLRHLRIDDKVILNEGLNSLTFGELQEANRVRGMRCIGISEERLKEQLQQWLDLSLNKKIPPSLLLLSQAFQLSETSPSEKSIAATIQALPTEVGTATKAIISEREGALDYETEIRLVKDELSKICEESREAQGLEVQKRKEQLMTGVSQEDVMVYKAKLKKKYEEEDIILKDLALLEEALVSKLFIEKDCLTELKQYLQQYEVNVRDIKEVLTNLRKTDTVKETSAAKRLHRKLIDMIKKLDDAISLLENREKEALTQPSIFSTHLSKDVVKIEELLAAIKKKNTGTLRGENILSEILHKLDHNQDGFLKINKISKFLNLLDDDEVRISSQKIDELIDLVRKEEKIAMDLLIAARK